MLDIAVAYNRFRFLGWEFLTWLWFMIENHPDTIAHVGPSTGSIEIGNRMVLEKRHESESIESITIKGDDAGLEEGLLALRKGAVVTEIALVFRSGDQEWRFTLKGESLSIGSLTTPPTGSVASEADLEGALIEKVYLVEQPVKTLDSLFSHFIKERLAPQWQTETLGKIKKWIKTENR
jgi:hypothetical protein